MKLRVIWPGKTRNPHLEALAEDYIARIRRFLPADVVQLKEPRTKNDRERIAAESDRIAARIAPTDFVVALDERGQGKTSAWIGSLIEKHMQEGARDLVFVVGGPAGLSDAIRKRADLAWSLSNLTLSHDLARTVLLEQIYRALALIRNLPYAR
jgi:23S rRNA (pseudouridine1915-N3)-methyltransferase